MAPRKKAFILGTITSSSSHRLAFRHQKSRWPFISSGDGVERREEDMADVAPWRVVRRDALAQAWRPVPRLPQRAAHASRNFWFFGCGWEL